LEQKMSLLDLTLTLLVAIVFVLGLVALITGRQVLGRVGPASPEARLRVQIRGAGVMLLACALGAILLAPITSGTGQLVSIIGAVICGLGSLIIQIANLPRTQH
jgi:hypothetical protein